MIWPFKGAKDRAKDHAKDPAKAATATACPTTPCGTCGLPMPIVAFDQACPRCRSRVPAARGCPGKCGGCEMGKQ